MAPTLRVLGTGTANPTATTAINPDVGSGATASDLSILSVAMKPYTTTITTPSGWTKLGEWTNGTVASGADTGSMKLALYYKIGASVGAIGNITFSGADSAAAGIITYQNTSGRWDVANVVSAGDTTDGTSWSTLAGSGLDLVASTDIVFTAMAMNSDTGTISSPTFVGMSGMTQQTQSGAFNAVNSQGNDCRLYCRYVNFSAGSSNAAPGFTLTTTSNTSGTQAFLRVRELTTVTDTAATTWATRAQITDTHATTWAVRTTVTDTAATSWAVRTRVTDSAATSWDVAAISTTPVGKTSATSWAVLARTTDTAVTSWSVRARVTDTAATTYAVRSVTTDTAVTSWAVRAPVTPKTAATTWSVRQRVLDSAATSWAVRTRVLDTAATTWATRGRVTDTAATSWDTAGALTQVLKSAATTWATRARALDSAATSWSVRAAVLDTAGTTWAVRARVTDSAPTGWDVRQRVTGSAPTTWDVLLPVEQTASTAWAVLEQITTSVDTTWQVAVIFYANVPRHPAATITSTDRGAMLVGTGARATITAPDREADL